jgi:hypothetical protein
MAVARGSTRSASRAARIACSFQPIERSLIRTGGLSHGAFSILQGTAAFKSAFVIALDQGAILAGLVERLVGATDVAAKFVVWTNVTDHVMAPIGGRETIAGAKCAAMPVSSAPRCLRMCDSLYTLETSKPPNIGLERRGKTAPLQAAPPNEALHLTARCARRK